jgi:hypothetical protein
MTPFEQASKNAQHFVEGFRFLELIINTIEEAEDLDEESADAMWLAILILLEQFGKMDDSN